MSEEIIEEVETPIVEDSEVTQDAETQPTEYVEFHRKYQPRVWDDFIGQEHIVAPLKRDIIENRRVQGRLFRGAAGTGKSSMVKVFTKAMNCEGRPADSADPCLACDSCVRFDAEENGGMYYFVGSVTSGVEDVRAIVNAGRVKQMMKAPYIIMDECHALSKFAWDAFLAYLENKDDMDSVPIIFCTTEAGGIKASISTRVQEYKFRNIPVPVLEQYVKDIADREGVEITDNGAAWCARAAQGSARGALKRLEEYLRNPDLYSVDESFATVLMREFVLGDIPKIHKALESVKQIDSALRDGTELAMNQLRHYIARQNKATVSLGDLPFADLPKQDVGLAMMENNLPSDTAMKVLKLMAETFHGFWNTTDENIIFEILWLDLTVRMHKHLKDREKKQKEFEEQQMGSQGRK
jgi:DNA polymerase III, gamma/tau subunits